MNTCPHCGQTVLPRPESVKEVPRTNGHLARRIVNIENKGEKDAAGNQVRRAKVVSLIDFYREGA